MPLWKMEGSRFHSGNKEEKRRIEYRNDRESRQKMKRWKDAARLCLFLISLLFLQLLFGAPASYGRGEEMRRQIREIQTEENQIQGVKPQESQTRESQSREELKLYAQSAVLIDGDSGRVLYGKNETKKRAMASTTKIMTCILALEHGNLEAQAEVSSYAASQPKVRLGMKRGETYTLKDLLYSLMLESHNDAAVVIAEHIGGSVSGFADMMNEKAGEIGCKNTWFITPNGLDAQQTEEDGSVKSHSTTAEDLARIMRYCISQSPQRELFLTITQTGNYSFSDGSRKRTFSCNNHNALLSMMNGAISGKTGFTGEAGYSYVGALERDGRTFIIALLGSGWPPHKSYKWTDARVLLEYGLEHYQYEEMWKPVSLEPVLVKEGIPEKGSWEQDPAVEVRIDVPLKEQSCRVLLKEGEQVTVAYDLKKSLQAPVREGETVGNIRYMLDGQVVGIYPVTAAESVEKITWHWCLAQVIEKMTAKTP